MNHPDVPTDDPNNPSNDPTNLGDPTDPTDNPINSDIIIFFDPCNCLGNESTQGDDGQFLETITLMGPANQTWTILSVDGLFQTNSPAPPAMAIPFPDNFQLAETVPGTYVLTGIHVDAIGYELTLTNGIDVINIPDNGRNTCYYPKGMLIGLNSNYCAADDAIVTVSPDLLNNSVGTLLNFEIIGTTDFTVSGNDLSFVPSSLASGTYTVVFEYDTGVAATNDPTDPGCIIELQATFTIDNPISILCRPPLNIVADEDFCEAATVNLLPPIVLNGGVGNLTVLNDAPTSFSVGTTTVNWNISDANGCFASCTQNVTISDNVLPEITCGNAFYANTSWENCGYPSYLLEPPTVSDNCGILSVTNDAPVFFEPGMYMPVWTVTDVNGNTASCMQWMTIIDTTLPKILSCPNDITVLAQTAAGSTVSWSLPTGMDNCYSNLIWVASNNPGDLFPIGTTNVLYTGYDEAGNSIECSFDVTVLPLPANLIVFGSVESVDGNPIENVFVDLTYDGQSMDNFSTAVDGMFEFSIGMSDDYSISAEKNNDLLNGVTTFDLVLIQKHILGIQQFDAAYKFVAADVNKSGSITTLDLVHLRKAILLIDNEFYNNQSWRFLKIEELDNIANNLDSVSSTGLYALEDVAQGTIEQKFIGIKIGDLNGSALSNNLLTIDDRTNLPELSLLAKDRAMTVGEIYEVEVFARDFNHLGFQFTLDIDERKATLIDIQSEFLSEDDFGYNEVENGQIVVSWAGATAQEIDEETPILTLFLQTEEQTRLSELLDINSSKIVAEAYNFDGSLQNIQLSFERLPELPFRLYQNVPNPFNQNTVIRFDLPKATSASLTITDLSGKIVYQTHRDFKEGNNQIEIAADVLPSSGVWYYRLTTETDSESRKILLMKQ